MTLIIQKVVVVAVVQRLIVYHMLRLVMHEDNCHILF